MHGKLFFGSIFELEIIFWVDGLYPSLSTPILNIHKYPPWGLRCISLLDSPGFYEDPGQDRICLRGLHLPKLLSLYRFYDQKVLVMMKMPCNNFNKTSFSRGYTSYITKLCFSDIPFIHEKLIIFSHIRNKCIIVVNYSGC